MSENNQREGIPMRVGGGDPIRMEVERVAVIEAVSPEVVVSGIAGGHRLTVTDLHGAHSFDVMDGAPGQPGQDGQDGAPGQPGQPGQDGRDGATGPAGADGFSPTITIADITGGHRVTITDADGAHSFDVMDGQDGGGDVTDVQVNGTSVVSGGVANVPVATNNTGVAGVVKIDTTYGLDANNGYARIYRARTDAIKASSGTYQPIVPAAQNYSVFYGLAKAAGFDEKDSTLPMGQYTESAKSAISQMLNGSVSVTGSTPSITALPGIRYVCGEVTTLDITLPASGIVDVVFESGSTATTLTITPPTGVTLKWANGFDPTALDADTTYEINIADGLGVAVGWT